MKHVYFVLSAMSSCFLLYFFKSINNELHVYEIVLIIKLLQLIIMPWTTYNDKNLQKLKEKFINKLAAYTLIVQTGSSFKDGDL